MCGRRGWSWRLGLPSDRHKPEHHRRNLDGANAVKDAASTRPRRCVELEIDAVGPGWDDAGPIFYKRVSTLR